MKKKEKKVEDIFCPHCQSSLMKKATVEFVCQTLDGQQGIIRLSPEPGDYTVYFTPSLRLQKGDLVYFHCPHCKKRLNLPQDKYELVAFGVKYSDKIMICYISAEYRIHTSIFVDMAGTPQFSFGETYPNLELMAEEWTKKNFKKIKDILCLECEHSLLITKGEKGQKIYFKFLRENGEKGDLFLSPIPYDYEVESSHLLKEGEVIKFFCPHCEKELIFEKNLVPFVVIYENNEAEMCFISAKKGEKRTIFWNSHSGFFSYGERARTLEVLKGNLAHYQRILASKGEKVHIGYENTRKSLEKNFS